MGRKKKMTIKTILEAAKQGINKINECRELVYGGLLYVMLRPELANAGFLSKGLCKPYKLLVDNELFMVAAMIMAVVLVLAWKFSPSGTVLAKGVGLMAALLVGLNVENIVQSVAGAGVVC